METVSNRVQLGEVRVLGLRFSGFHRRSHAVLTNTKPCGVAGEQHLAEVRAAVIETLRIQLKVPG